MTTNNVPAESGLSQVLNEIAVKNFVLIFKYLLLYFDEVVKKLDELNVNGNQRRGRTNKIWL